MGEGDELGALERWASVVVALERHPAAWRDHAEVQAILRLTEVWTPQMVRALTAKLLNRVVRDNDERRANDGRATVG